MYSKPLSILLNQLVYEIMDVIFVDLVIKEKNEISLRSLKKEVFKN